MKNLMLLLAFSVPIIFFCSKCCSKKFPLEESCDSGVNQKSQQYKFKQMCRQVIVDLSTPDGEKKRQWLIKNDYVVIDSCSCNPRLQVWGNESVEKVELLTTEEPTPTKGKVNGDDYSLNYVLELGKFEPVDTTNYPQDSLIRIEKSADGLPQVIIANIDTGIDSLNPFLYYSIWQNPAPGSGCVQHDYIGFNFADPANPSPTDRNRHGTFTAGILAGTSTLSEKAPDVAVKVMSLKFTDGNSGEGSLFKGVCAMYYAIQHGAKVINLSWGFESPTPPAIMKPLLEYARANQVLIVASAGNSKSNNDLTACWPAGFSTYPEYDVVAVAGLDKNNDGIGPTYSNYGANSVTLAAPGYEIVSTDLGVGKIRMTGTSAAAPFVSHSAAITMARTPTLSAEDVKKCLSNISGAGGQLDPLPLTPPLPSESPASHQNDFIKSKGRWNKSISKNCN